jgi:hypothetical protein
MDLSLSRRFALLGVCIAVSATAAAAAASPAEAIGVRNSECVPGNNGFAIISYGNEWADTFPADHTGKLLTVDLKNVARAAGGTAPDIDVRVYGTESGVPVDPALASTTIPTESIAADNFFHDYTANFAPGTAAYLSAGKTYALTLGTTDTVQNAWGFHDGNPCAGSSLFYRAGTFAASDPGYDAGLITYLGPANDDLEHAQELTGREVVEEGTTAGATRQGGEPDHYVTNPPDSDFWQGDHSVWFKWTAPNTGPTTIDTCVGEIDSILAVYTGDELASLTRVADNNNDPACSGHNVYGSKVSFEAVGGTTYDIAVGDAGGAREKPFEISIVGSDDITPPQTQIDSGPSGATTDDSPMFAFSSSEPGSTFECRLDSSQESAFGPCASPKSYISLPLGPHNFEVRAIDAAANVDPTPAARSFTIEASPAGSGQSGPMASGAAGPPDTRISKARISQAKDRATFRFASTVAGSSFVCRIDRKAAKPCHSPKSYGHLRPGRHIFSVNAVDAAGIADPTPALRRFRISP